MNFKPKFKPKLLQKAVALLTATTLSLTLAIPAIAAVWGDGEGYLITAQGGGYAWGTAFDSPINSWRVTLYVSTKDDGTIDPKTDTIGSSTLAKVGTIVYDNIFNNDLNAEVFIQITQHAESRLAELPLRFPYVSQVISTDKYIPYSNVDRVGGGDLIYHSTDCPAELPTFGAYTNAPSGSEPFIQKVTENLNQFLGGTSDNFKPLYAKVAAAGACKSGTIAGQKLADAYASMGLAGYDLLLPTNPDCVVQWACVVEPLVERRTNSDGTFFEFHLAEGGPSNIVYFSVKTAVQTSPAAHQYMLLDAYGTAQYNETSRKLYGPDVSVYADDIHLEAVRRKTTIMDLTTKSHSSRSCLESWADKGQLQSEYGSLLANSATSCYDTHAGYTYYCGVPVAGSLGSSLNYGSVEFTNLSAQYGGIAVLINELKEGIPVYYYIYDDKNNFTGEIITDSYTPDDAGFIPKQDYGIPIADESISSTDQPLVSTTGKQMYFYYNDYASTRTNLVDFKGTSAESEWINPKAITEPIKTRVDVAYRVTKEAKSIHVKSIKPPSVDIVYHIYTYSAEDESYDTLSALTGKDLEEAVKDMTPKVSSTKRSIVLSPTQTSYQASADTNAEALGTLIHVTATLAGMEAELTNDHCPDHCDPGKRNWIVSASSPKVYKPNGTAVFRAEPTTVVSFNDTGTGTGTRQIHVKVINVKKAPTAGQSAHDRIKSYDVTRLIEATQQTATGSFHLTKPATQSCALF